MKPVDQAIAMLTGRSIVAGETWDDEAEHSDWFGTAFPDENRPPAERPIQFVGYSAIGHRPLPVRYCSATTRAISRITPVAWYRWLWESDPAVRSAILRRISVRAEERRPLILALASRETGLTRRRLGRELDRACHTLNLFATLVDEGSWVRAAIDTGDTAVGPFRHDIRRMLRPLGAVAVFGASNFPIAYGAIGGDTASAIAAGCAVVVKGHPAHPGTGELLARTATDAIRDVTAHLPAVEMWGAREWPFLFSFLHSGGAAERSVGEAIVTHESIAAVGFTGSLSGGTALNQLAQSRRRPVPVFAEMGSTNPVFVFPNAATRRTDEIATQLARSILDSSGQQCTRPGVVFVAGPGNAERLAGALVRAFKQRRPRCLLSRGIAERYAERASAILALATEPQGIDRPSRDELLRGAPVVVQLTWTAWHDHPQAREEVFGPAVIVIPAYETNMYIPLSDDELPGVLAVSIYLDDDEQAALPLILPRLARFAGRIIFNGPPTGVRVAHAMVHGGPFPATNRPDTTAVGPLAIERWCRPVCFQNCPDSLLPPELKDANPLGIDRLVNGVRTRDRL